MATFKKQDLLHSYFWESGKSEDLVSRKYAGKITLDKTNGNEVLFFCINFLEENNIALTLTNLHHVERCIHLTDLENTNSKILLNQKILRNWYNYLNMQVSGAGYLNSYI